MKKMIEKITQFRDEKGWLPFHNEKDLAISISLEANELLENFQWKSSEEADVLIYLLQLADKMDIDLEEEVFKKMKKNAIKYPINEYKEPAMIIYETTKTEFISDVINELLVERLYQSYQEKVGRTSKQEIVSWENSLQRMCNVMQDREIPHDASVAIEFKIPNTSKRIDFIVAGSSGDQDHVVIVELKQWSEVEKITSQDGVVKTFVGGRMNTLPHQKIVPDNRYFKAVV